MKILVTGISGFVGSRVAASLLREGHGLVGLSRAPQRVEMDVPVVFGDAAAGTGLTEALRGVDAAYYLIHSLESGNEEGFASRDRRAATRFAQAARRAGVGRLVYLGVPSPADPERATEHIRSRQEVEAILREAVPDTVGLRSWFVVSGHSPSFRVTMELLRQPFVALPPWRDNATRPVDVRDLVDGLVASATSEAAAGRSLDLMGPDTVTTGELMRRVAAAMGAEPEFVEMNEEPPAEAVRQAAESVGGDPELVVPLTAGLGSGDILPTQDAAPVLGLELRSLDDAIAHAVKELVAT